MEAQMSIRSRILTTVLTLAAFLALPMVSFAQPIDIPAIVTLDSPEKTWTFAAYTHQFETDLDDSPGDFSRDGVMAGFGHRFDLGDDSYFALQGTYVGSYYDFSNSAGSLNGNPSKTGRPYRWNATSSGNRKRPSNGSGGSYWSAP